MAKKHHHEQESATDSTIGATSGNYPETTSDAQSAAVEAAPAAPAETPAAPAKSAATQSIEDLSKAFTSAKRIIKKIEALPVEARKLIRDAIAKIEA